MTALGLPRASSARRSLLGAGVVVTLLALAACGTPEADGIATGPGGAQGRADPAPGHERRGGDGTGHVTAPDDVEGGSSPEGRPRRPGDGQAGSEEAGTGRRAAGDRNLRDAGGGRGPRRSPDDGSAVGPGGRGAGDAGGAGSDLGGGTSGGNEDRTGGEDGDGPVVTPGGPPGEPSDGMVSWAGPGPQSPVFVPPDTFRAHVRGEQVERTVVVRNDGHEDVVLDEIVLQGPDRDAFSVEPASCSGAVLAPGESCAVTVTYLPTEGGTELATLVVSSQNAPVAEVPLQGEAMP